VDDYENSIGKTRTVEEKMTLSRNAQNLENQLSIIYTVVSRLLLPDFPFILNCCSFSLSSYKFCSLNGTWLFNVKTMAGYSFRFLIFNFGS
jgi:hypothetical protein